MSKLKNHVATTPIIPNFSIECACELSPANKAAVDAINASATRIEKSVAELITRFMACIVKAFVTSPAESVHELSACELERSKLRRERAEHSWRRFHLLPDLTADLERAVEIRLAEYDEIVSAKHDEAVAAGAVGGEGLKYRCQQDLECIAARGRLTTAQADLEAHRGNCKRPPYANACRIDWPSLEGDALGLVLLGLAEKPVSELALSPPAETYRELVGLKGSELLPEHRKALESLVDASGVSRVGGQVAKFTALNPTVAEKMRPILERLPENDGRNKQLANLRDCSRTTVRRNADANDRPRTFYDESRSGFRQDADAMARMVV